MRQGGNAHCLSHEARRDYSSSELDMTSVLKKGTEKKRTFNLVSLRFFQLFLLKSSKKMILEIERFFFSLIFYDDQYPE